MDDSQPLEPHRCCYAYYGSMDVIPTVLILARQANTRSGEITCIRTIGAIFFDAPKPFRSPFETVN